MKLAALELNLSVKKTRKCEFLEQWFGLPDPAMEEAFFDVPLHREFARLGELVRLLDESTILRFCHRLEKHKLVDGILANVNELLSSQGLLLRQRSAVDANFIPVPSSTKNRDGTRYPEVHSSKKGRQWHVGVKAHIGVDADSELVQTVCGTAGRAAVVTKGNARDRTKRLKRRPPHGLKRRELQASDLL